MACVNVTDWGVQEESVSSAQIEYEKHYKNKSICHFHHKKAGSRAGTSDISGYGKRLLQKFKWCRTCRFCWPWMQLLLRNIRFSNLLQCRLAKAEVALQHCLHRQRGEKQCTFDSLYAKISSSDDGVSSNLDPGKKTKHILPKNCPFNSNETASLPRFDKHIPASVAKWSITLIHRGKRLTSELYKCSPMFCVYTGFS